MRKLCALALLLAGCETTPTSFEPAALSFPTTAPSGPPAPKPVSRPPTYTARAMKVGPFRVEAGATGDKYVSSLSMAQRSHTSRSGLYRPVFAWGLFVDVRFFNNDRVPHTAPELMLRDKAGNLHAASFPAPFAMYSPGFDRLVNPRGLLEETWFFSVMVPADEPFEVVYLWGDQPVVCPLTRKVAP